MNRNKVTVSVIIMSLLMSFTALADSEDREKITKVEIDIPYDVQESAVYAYPETEDDTYTIDDCEVVNEPFDEDGWGDFDVPRLKIYMTANDGYYFSSTSKGTFKFGSKDITFVDAQRDEDKTSIELTVDLVPINGDIGNPSNLKWGSKGQATWDKAYGGKKYELKVIRNDSTVNNEALKTTGTTIDCIKYIGDTGNYKFKVRAINSDGDYSQWVESYEWVVTEDILKTLDAKWEAKANETVMKSPGVIQGTTGWIKDTTGWWHRNLDGGYTSNNWQAINNKWYYFDNTGYMATGWQYLNSKWYYLTADGSMATGWQQVSDKWYYMAEDGHMLSSMKTPDGYNVDKSGAWVGK